MTSAKVCGNCIAGVKPCLGTPCALATTPTTDAREREAREDVECLVQVTHEFSCARVKKVRGKWVIDRLVKCDCGEGDKGNATIDAYRTAILAAERARVRAVVEGIVPTLVVDWNTATGRECLPRADVLQRLGEDCQS